METGDLNFVIWWYAVLCVLGIAGWYSIRSQERVDWNGVSRIFLVGIGAGLALYLAPRGLTSIGTSADLQLRFFGALAMAWLGAMRTFRSQPGPCSCSALALAGFCGVNAPLLAYAASVYMVTGQPGAV